MREKIKYGKVFFVFAVNVIPIISEKTGRTTGRSRVRITRTDKYGNQTQNSIQFPHDPYNGTNAHYLEQRAEKYRNNLLKNGLRRKVKLVSLSPFPCSQTV